MADLNAMTNPLVFAETTLGFRPHAVQADFLVDEHPVRVVVGGRRAGKSKIVAAAIVWELVRHCVAGKRFKVLIGAPVLDQGRLLLRAVSDMLKGSPAGGLITRESSTPFPELQLGADVVVTLRAASDDGRAMRGHSANIAVIDEAGYLADRVVQEAVMPMLADSGGRLIIASTPTTRGGFLEQMYRRGLDASDSRVRAFSMPSASNPHVDAEYIAAQRRELPERIFRTEYEGEFADETDAAFKWEAVKACAHGIECEPMAGRRYIVGYDPARSRDRSAVVVLDVSERPFRLTHMADLRGVEWGEQARQVAAIAKRWSNAKVVIDGTGLGDVMASMLRAESAWVEPVVFTAARKAEMVMALAVLIERHGIEFPPHRDLLDEFRFYEARGGARGTTTYGAPEGSSAHDDYVSGLLLAVRGAGAFDANIPDDMPIPILRSAYHRPPPRTDVFVLGEETWLDVPGAWPRALR